MSAGDPRPDGPRHDGPTACSASPTADRRGWMLVCPSAELRERGAGLRFDWGGQTPAGRPLPAFVIRHGGRVFAYLNQCAHVPVELDWQPGQFLDETGDFLICATHGAMYRPADGHCVSGPCRGRRLKALVCEEVDGRVWVNFKEAHD